MKLKRSELAGYRQRRLELQYNICALCSEPITDDAVLDHDHKTGLIRSVLHRGCNILLGKVENNMARSRVDLKRLANWARNLHSYITRTHTDLTHPTYKTPEERAMKKKKKPIKPGKGRY